MAVGVEEERRRLAGMLPGAEIGFARGEFVALVRDVDAPIAVLVERGGRGGARAAPLAGSLMKAYFDTVAPK